MAQAAANLQSCAFSYDTLTHCRAAPAGLRPPAQLPWPPSRPTSAKGTACDWEQISRHSPSLWDVGAPSTSQCPSSSLQTG